MARPSESKSRPSSPHRPEAAKLAKPVPPVKPVGIIILPPEYRQADDEDSPSSSTCDPMLNPSSSLPDLGVGEQRTLRRATTSTTSLNVKFAPLPQLAPRKRRSTAPMGIASRGAVMRRRRAGTPGFDMNGDPLPPTPPMWTPEEVEAHTQRVLTERGELPAVRDHAEDPFLKMVKGAGKLWRKVNNNDKKKQGQGAPTAEVKGVTVVSLERPALAVLPGGDNTPSGEEEGGVWEEEVGDRFPLNVGQTETIVEGQFPWSGTLKADDETESVSDEQNVSSTESTEEDSTLESHTERESSSLATLTPPRS
ncbi:hypothetical protein MSAN_00731900 [Mycena sanguinolenta]|uniref:Uncharacterized protein n=1 Tax=Mycena sanguinolenta TaxID=230812 RepID=A0A8H7DFC2_9AGAR|nr:hypothetical protein MSAN_00731900 [Mycena sanguinolenta]